MKVVNRSNEEAYVNLSKNRDAALKALEAVREATQDPNAVYIKGKRIDPKQAEN
jgi:UDP-N-acetylmuramyl tripeptide synthase